MEKSQRQRHARASANAPAATLYHGFSVDPCLEMRDRLSRPLTLCDGRVIEALVRGAWYNEVGILETIHENY